MLVVGECSYVVIFVCDTITRCRLGPLTAAVLSCLDDLFVVPSFRCNFLSVLVTRTFLLSVNIWLEMFTQMSLERDTELLFIITFVAVHDVNETLFKMAWHVYVHLAC